MADKRKQLIAHWIGALLGLLAIRQVVTRALKTRKAGKLAAMKEQVYEDNRPAKHFTKYHRRARTKQPNWVYRVVRWITVTYSRVFHTKSVGKENVPATGSVLIAPNHFSYMDHFFVGRFIWPRMIRYMAKSQIFKWPMSLIYSHGGVFPVRRGRKDEEAMTTARIILEQGGVVQMYVQGGRSRTGKVEGPAKPGIGRLALETGAPVVPVAIYGSSKVRNWKYLQFPRVIVRYGELLSWPKVDSPTRHEQQVVADAVLETIKELYNDVEKGTAKRRKRYWWS